MQAGVHLVEGIISKRVSSCVAVGQSDVGGYGYRG